LIRFLFTIFLCGLLFFAGGCWDILLIEDLAMVIAIGFDVDPENPDLMVVTMTSPTLSEEKKEPMATVTVKAESIDQALHNVQRQSEDILVLGQTNVLVFCEEFARSGRLSEVMSQLSQLRDINANAKVVVVKGATAQNVLQLSSPVEPRAAVYLVDLLERNHFTGMINQATVSEYWRKHYTLGIDPVVALIDITGHEDEKEGFRVAGAGLFNSAGKMTGTLTDEEVISYNIITGDAPRRRFITKVKISGHKRNVSGLIERSKVKIKTKIKDKPSIDVRMELIVDGLDADWDANVLDPKVTDKLAKLLAKDFQGNIQELFEKSQKVQADFAGLGRHVRVQHSEWFNGKDWAEEYKDADISVSVKVTVRRIGTMVKPES
jgi:Ger(x)C family germination protein